MLQKLSKLLNEKCISKQSLRGGDIADSYLVKTDNGAHYFVKTGMKNPRALRCEANGLQALANTETIKIPKIIFVNEEFLVLEYINQGSKGKEFFSKFGEAFAKMHKSGSSYFGFFEDNFIGNTPQKNTKTELWEDFYREYRLKYQLDLLKQNGYWSDTIQHFYDNLDEIVKDVLKGSEEQPSILHGDLWNGNFMVYENNEVCLIDPAVYYGHREADLALTKLFGGFSDDFYKSYQKTFPLQKDWEYREGLYKLYHVLNHANLFGISYFHSAEAIIKSYH